MTSREQFDEWAILRGYNVYYAHEYLDQETQRAWLAWQAGLVARDAGKCVWTPNGYSKWWTGSCGHQAETEKIEDLGRPCWCGKRIEIKED